MWVSTPNIIKASGQERSSRDEMCKVEVKLERAAHHESGHIVVAARLGLRLRPEGLNVDPAGEGLACCHKNPDNSDISKERVIVASML